LLLASCCGHVDVVRLLLTKGANVNIPDNVSHSRNIYIPNSAVFVITIKSYMES